MSFPRTIAEEGVKIIRHHDRQYEVPIRLVEWGGILVKEDSMGNYVFDENIKMADHVCYLAWETANPQKRTSGFANAWPVVLAKTGGGGGGEPDSPGNSPNGNQAGAGFTFSGVNTNFSSGSAQAGASFSGTRNNFSNGSPNAGATFTDPPSGPDYNSPAHGGYGHPTGPGNGSNNPAGGGGQQGAPVATPARKNKCGSMSGPHQMLPILNEDYGGDDRFKTLDIKPPEYFPKLPRGFVGIAIAGTEEYEQKNLFFPTDPRLVAVNYAGDPKMGSLVCDLNSDFEIDKNRRAPLQSAFRVLVRPLGKANALAVQLNESGCGDTRGGFVYDIGEASATAAGASVTDGLGGGSPLTGATVVMDAEKERPWVIAMLSVNDGGYIDVGSEDDKHHKGFDGDGTCINSAHISTKALFRRNRVEDGPLRFEQVYKDGDDFDNAVKVHLAWTGVDWAWWTSTPFPLIPTEPLRPTKPRPTYPNYPLRPGGYTLTPTLATPGVTATTGTPTTGAGQTNPATTSGTPTDAASEALDDVIRAGESSTPADPVPPDTWQPQPFEPGDFAPGGKYGPALMTLALTGINTVGTTESVVGQSFLAGQIPLAAAMMLAQSTTWGTDGIATAQQKGSKSSPISGGMSSYSAQGGSTNPGGCGGGSRVGAEGDPWVYTQRPGASRFATGTASGGWVIHPPETTPADQFDYGMVPPNVTLSTTYMVVAPGAYFAAGTPNLADGGVTSGWSWGMDSATGDLLWRTHASATTATGIRFVLSTQNLAWYSGTSFLGEFDHSNTASRLYSFPDADGTVTLNSVGLFTQGSVIFAGVGGLLSQNNASFFWDNASVRLGIGTNSPAVALHVTAKGRFGDDIQFDATGKALVANTSDGSDSYYIGLAGGGGLSTTRGAYFELAGNEESARKGRLFFAAGNAAGPTGDQASIVFNAGGGDKAILLPGGNFGIGTSGPDRRLDVLDASNPQLRLTHTDGSVYCDFQVDSGGDVVLTPSGNAISFTPGTQVAQDTDGLRIVRSVASSHTWTQINSYGGTSTFIASVNGFSVQGEFAFYTADNGVSITNRLYLSPATAVVNEDGADCDFRVEGDTVTHLLFVDAGSDFVAIGSPETVLQTAASFRVFHASTAGMIVREKTNDIEGEWFAYNSWPTGIGAAVGFGTVSNHGLNLITNDTTRACITAGGNVGINTAGPDRKLDILDASNPQLRLTYTDGSVYTDFQTDSSGILNVIPSSGVAGMSLSLSGGTVDWQIINTSNTASSAALIYLATGASADDPFIRFDITSTKSWVFGIDNSDSDSFKFCDGNAIGSGDRLTFVSGGALIVNEPGSDLDFRVESDDESYCLFVEGTLNNIVLCANSEPGFNSMDGGVFLAEANVVPTGDPTAGGYIYVEGGALKFRGSSGTVTTIANA